jgi:hypothetical protein
MPARTNTRMGRQSTTHDPSDANRECQAVVVKLFSQREAPPVIPNKRACQPPPGRGMRCCCVPHNRECSPSCSPASNLLRAHQCGTN